MLAWIRKVPDWPGTMPVFRKVNPTFWPVPTEIVGRPPAGGGGGVGRPPRVRYGGPGRASFVRQRRGGLWGLVGARHPRLRGRGPPGGAAFLPPAVPVGQEHPRLSQPAAGTGDLPVRHRGALI